MPAVTIRDVPEDTRNALAARAARNGQSLQEFLRATLIEFAAKPDLNELLDGVRARKEASGVAVGVSEILGALDADRR